MRSQMLLRYLIRRNVAVPIAWALTLIHPVIHGTFLDSGGLDLFLLNMQMWAIGAPE